MDDNKKDHSQLQTNQNVALIDGIEQLSLVVSILRSLAACPSLFDHISLDDRQNLLLLALEHAEMSRERLSQAV